MIIGRGRFNIYLLLALVTIIACGCRTHKNDKDKQIATFRVYLEANPGITSNYESVPIYRANPTQLTIDREPFIFEAHVAAARVVEVLGGFDLQVQLNRQGTWLLQDYSATNPGKRYAIFTQFGEKGKQTRWLAAPQFSKVISDGLLQFTPDASREECDAIVLGLSNVVKMNAENSKW